MRYKGKRERGGGGVAAVAIDHPVLWEGRLEDAPEAFGSDRTLDPGKYPQLYFHQMVSKLDPSLSLSLSLSVSLSLTRSLFHSLSPSILPSPILLVCLSTL